MDTSAGVWRSWEGTGTGRRVLNLGRAHLRSGQGHYKALLIFLSQKGFYKSWVKLTLKGWLAKLFHSKATRKGWTLSKELCPVGFWDGIKSYHVHTLKSSQRLPRAHVITTWRTWHINLRLSGLVATNVCVISPRADYKWRWAILKAKNSNRILSES